MNIIATTIVESANISMGYARRLLTGISADQFARLAPGATEHGGEPQRVRSNHPAFVYGHLSLYASRILADVGADTAGLEPSQDFLEKFKNGAECVDDPNGSVYPAMDVITERFFAGYEAALAAIANVDDSAYSVPNANEAMRERFSSMASMHGFYLGGHMMIHMGQISAWRRMMDLPPA